MPLNHRTPLIGAPQPDRRTSTSDTTAIVVATRTVESAITETVPAPAPLEVTGLTGGIVKAGGARTGGREPAGSPRPVVELGGDGGVAEPLGCGAATLAAVGRGRGVGDGVRFGTAVGAGVSVGRGDGDPLQHRSPQQ
jgi:hypothetical protein